MGSIVHYLPAALAALALIGCGGGDQAPAPASGGDGVQIVVSVPPQADFVRRIGGGRVRVEILVGEGQDPHRFSPSPAQMKTLSRAQIYFTAGMPFEEPLAKRIAAAHTGLQLVDTSSGIDKLAQQHDHAGAHGHHGGDPHIWLAPPLIQRQAAHIAAALGAADPAGAEIYAANLERFNAELDTLHAELSKQTAPLRGGRFFVFHPAFGYFGQSYGIEQVAVEIGGHNPTPKELAAFLATAKAAGVRTLFVQPQFDRRAAERVAEALGAQVVAIDPLAADVLPNLRRIAAALAAAR